MEGILVSLFAGMVIFFLYNYGYIGITSKAAVVFIGSMPKKNSWKASFSQCSGHMRRVIRFDECKRYEFSLDAEIEKGSLLVEVYNTNKELVLTLDSNCKSGIVDVENSKKYYMSVRIKSATGKYYVSWE